LPIRAKPEAIALAIVSIVSATDDAEACGRTMGRAAKIARTASRATILTLGIEDPTMARFEAFRSLAAICGACGDCPRGVDLELAGIMQPAPRS
jgi:hypothetical protein